MTSCTARLQRSRPSPADRLNRWFQRWLTQHMRLQPVPGAPLVRVRAWRQWIGWIPRPLTTVIDLHWGYPPMDQLPLLSISDWRVRSDPAGNLGASTASTLMQVPVSRKPRKARLIFYYTLQVFFYDQQVFRHRLRPQRTGQILSMTYRLKPEDSHKPEEFSIDRGHWLSDGEMKTFWENRLQQRQARRQVSETKLHPSPALAESPRELSESAELSPSPALAESPRELSDEPSDVVDDRKFTSWD